MANKIMKTLTVGNNTYEVVDAAARDDIENFKGTVTTNINNFKEEIATNISNFKEEITDDIDDLKEAVVIDNTLTQSGKAADSKVVGDTIGQLIEEIANVTLIDIDGSIDNEAIIVSKPQNPLQHKDGDYFYPLTTADQVIFDDSTRLDTKLNNFEANMVKMNATIVELTVDGWDNKVKTVEVPNVTLNSNVFIAPTPTTYTEYIKRGIFCVEQGEGTLTFECTKIPTIAVSVNVSIFE